MSRDDIIRMARDWEWIGGAEGWTFNSYQDLERFAHLVMDHTLTTMHRAIAHEREACAQLAEGWKYLPENNFSKEQIVENMCKTIAHYIRARGQA